MQPEKCLLHLQKGFAMSYHDDLRLRYRKRKQTSEFARITFILIGAMVLMPVEVLTAVAAKPPANRQYFPASFKMRQTASLWPAHKSQRQQQSAATSDESERAADAPGGGGYLTRFWTGMCHRGFKNIPVPYTNFS